MVPIGPPAEPRCPNDSAHLCLAALELYVQLFDRCCEVEPDVGFAYGFASGRLAIQARAGARPWLVPTPALDAVVRLFETVERLDAERVGEWVDRFPGVFLAAIERRRVPRAASSLLGPDSPGRRFEEQQPARRPSPLVLV